MSSLRSIFVPSHQLKRRWTIMLFSLLLLGGAMPYRTAKAVSLQAQTFSISGRVVDGFGNGIGSATVTLSGTQAATTTTDESGNYAFNNLPAGGNYNLSPSKAAGQYTSFAAVVNNLSSNQTVNLRLDSYVTVYVRVTDASGNGIGGVAIAINNQTFGFAQTNAFGVVNLSLSVAATNNSNPPITLTAQKPGYVFDPPSVTFNSGSGNQSVNFKASISNSPVSYIQFGESRFNVGEGDGNATITVTRTGNTTSAVAVNYFTGDAGVATQQRDYTMAAGTLNFAPGETSKTFQVLITDNAYVQGNHGLFLQLSTPTGGALLGSPAFVTLTIVDNDAAQPTINPLDDGQFFVRQHYSDFLNRAPDQGGFDYWTSQFARCNADADCLRNTRVGVSAAFFVEQEFQQTGFTIYRLNRAALGLVPAYAHFMLDRNRLIGGAQLQQSTIDFTNEFVERGVFKQFYPDSLAPEQFVNKLFTTAGLAAFTQEQAQEIQDMTTNGKTRAQLLLDVIELPAFKSREFNLAFVLMQYYGYLRRDPDAIGYQFWLDILNNRVPNNYRSMVCAFINSAEYQLRFSPVLTRNDKVCSNIGQ